MICITYFITVLSKVNLKDRKLFKYAKNKKTSTPATIFSNKQVKVNKKYRTMYTREAKDLLFLDMGFAC